MPKGIEDNLPDKMLLVLQAEARKRESSVPSLHPSIWFESVTCLYWIDSAAYNESADDLFARGLVYLTYDREVALTEVGQRRVDQLKLAEAS